MRLRRLGDTGGTARLRRSVANIWSAIKRLVANYRVVIVTATTFALLGFYVYSSIPAGTDTPYQLSVSVSGSATAKIYRSSATAEFDRKAGMVNVTFNVAVLCSIGESVQIFMYQSDPDASIAYATGYGPETLPSTGRYGATSEVACRADGADAFAEFKVPEDQILSDDGAGREYFNINLTTGSILDGLPTSLFVQLDGGERFTDVARSVAQGGPRSVRIENNPGEAYIDGVILDPVAATYQQVRDAVLLLLGGAFVGYLVTFGENGRKGGSGTSVVSRRGTLGWEPDRGGYL